jgi:hypothetical protein
MGKGGYLRGDPPLKQDSPRGAVGLTSANTVNPNLAPGGGSKNF